jgi:2-haloacid dehalogenase
MRDRWATFDCYGTLIDWEGGIRNVFGRLWPEADAQRLLGTYHVVEPVIQSHGELPYREVQKRALRAIAAVEGLPLSAADENGLADSLPSWPAFPEVPNALSELKAAGWRLAILSNTDPDLLAASLEQIGVDVDLTITAREAGSYKPAHRHWQRFFHVSQADRARHAHVAASLFHDIAPADALGLTAVWINRLGETSALSRAAELTDLRDLPTTLDRLVPRSTESKQRSPQK